MYKITDSESMNDWRYRCIISVKRIEKKHILEIFDAEVLTKIHLLPLAKAISENELGISDFYKLSDRNFRSIREFYTGFDSYITPTMITLIDIPIIYFTCTAPTFYENGEKPGDHLTIKAMSYYK